MNTDPAPINVRDLAKELAARSGSRFATVFENVRSWVLMLDFTFTHVWADTEIPAPLADEIRAEYATAERRAGRTPVSDGATS